MPRLAFLFSRGPKKADTTRNARRRYERAGERLEQQAAKESGTAAERLRQLAEENYKKAVALYDDKKAQARFAAKHEIATPKKSISEGGASRLIDESANALESARQDPARRRELETREIMRGPVGSRIMAATKDIWYDANAPKQDMALAYQKIMHAFGANSMADVIKRFEDELGEDLYKEPASEGDRYKRDSPITIQAEKLARRVMRDAK